MSLEGRLQPEQLQCQLPRSTAAAHQRLPEPATALHSTVMSKSRLECRYTNGAFCVDMPRGCCTVMENGSYAANGLKHCVRPVDMAGQCYRPEMPVLLVVYSSCALQWHGRGAGTRNLDESEAQAILWQPQQHARAHNAVVCSQLSAHSICGQAGRLQSA